jgi:hypothetical protein
MHIHENQIAQQQMVAQEGTWNPTLKITENGALLNTKRDIGNFTADANGNGTITLLQMNGTSVLVTQ